MKNANQSANEAIPVVKGGETVAFGQADFFGLDVLLSFAFTLNPGQRLSVSFQIFPAVFPGDGGHAIADFCCSAQLSMVLPIGAQVSNDTGQTLSWVTTTTTSIPEPATMWLLLAGLAVVLALSSLHRGKPVS